MTCAVVDYVMAERARRTRHCRCQHVTTPNSPVLPDFTVIRVEPPARGVTYEDYHRLLFKLGAAFADEADTEYFYEGGFRVAGLGSRFHGPLVKYLGNDAIARLPHPHFREYDCNLVVIPPGCPAGSDITLRHQPYGDKPKTLCWTVADAEALIRVLCAEGWGVAWEGTQDEEEEEEEEEDIAT